MTVHINDFVSTVGRKPLSGDVLELPHLRDEFALNEFDVAMPRYFVIDDVGRAAEGFSKTWYPHLYRLKLKKIVDSQQYADILTKPVDTNANFVGDYDPTQTYTTGQIVRYQGTLYTVTATTPINTPPPNTGYFSTYGGQSLQDILSTNSKNLQINNAIIAQAEADAPLSGYDTRHLYTLAVDEKGQPSLYTVDDASSPPDASTTSLSADAIAAKPKRTGYTGYLVGDGVPINGADFGFGIAFPAGAQTDDYFLRTDFLPNRLFRYDGLRWIKIEDAVRHTMTNTDSRNTHRLGFINNKKYTYTMPVADDVVSVNQTFIDSQPNTENVINTTIDYDLYHTALYVVVKQSITEFDFAVSDYSELITSYTVGGTDLIRITLPDGVKLPLPGQWTISLYNKREAQRQSISKALRPKADF